MFKCGKKKKTIWLKFPTRHCFALELTYGLVGRLSSPHRVSEGPVPSTASPRPGAHGAWAAMDFRCPRGGMRTAGGGMAP